MLTQIGLVPDRVVPTAIDERPERGERPRDLARRLALAKAEAAVADSDGAYVLGADTVVACGRRILGKAEDAKGAHRFLSLLSGRRHRVYGGIAVIGPEGHGGSRVVMTQVHFKRLEERELRAYLDTNEWHGKAGAYGIQGLAGAFVTGLNGSYFNVVGLPLYETVALLNGLGYSWPRQ